MEDQIRENGLQCRKISHSWMIFPMKKNMFFTHFPGIFGFQENQSTVGVPHKGRLSTVQSFSAPGDLTPRHRGANLQFATRNAHVIGTRWEKSRGNYGFCHQTDQIWLNMGLSCKLMQIVPPIQ
jgi:hypothetical protein